MSITARTSEYALRERHRLSMSTDAAGLTRVGRIDFDQDSPSFCRFGVQMGKEGRPRGVRNAFGKTMVVHHPVDGQILNSNDAISIHDGTGVLVSEVLSTPGNTFMHPRYPFRCFCRSGVPLASLECLRCTFAKAFSSLRKKRGLAISSPVDRVAKVVSPTSIPTCSVRSGSLRGSHSTEKQAYHLPVEERW